MPACRRGHPTQPSFRRRALWPALGLLAALLGLGLPVLPALAQGRTDLAISQATPRAATPAPTSAGTRSGQATPVGSSADRSSSSVQGSVAAPTPTPARREQAPPATVRAAATPIGVAPAAAATPTPARPGQAPTPMAAATKIATASVGGDGVSTAPARAPAATPRPNVGLFPEDPIGASTSPAAPPIRRIGTPAPATAAVATTAPAPPEPAETLARVFSPAPRFGSVLAGRSRPGEPTWAFDPPPIEAAALDNFLRARGSPMAGLGEELLKAGWRYNVDPRLIVAIAGAETSFGRALCTSYNAWNWFWWEWCNSPFESWEQVLDEVARGLRVGYLDQGLTDVDSIAARYCPLDDPRDTLGVNRHWPANVAHYLKELGATRCNLTWVQTSAACAAPRSASAPRPSVQTVPGAERARANPAPRDEGQPAAEDEGGAPVIIPRSASWIPIRAAALAEPARPARPIQLRDPWDATRPPPPWTSREDPAPRVTDVAVAGGLSAVDVAADTPPTTDVVAIDTPPPADVIAADAAPGAVARPISIPNETTLPEASPAAAVVPAATRDLIAIILLGTLVVAARAARLLSRGSEGRSRGVVSWLRGRIVVIRSPALRSRVNAAKDLLLTTLRSLATLRVTRYRRRRWANWMGR